MGYYKDYGDPPITNTTGRIAGTEANINEKGNGTLIAGAQFARGIASAPLCIREKEGPIEWVIEPSGVLTIGGLEEALAVAVKDGETELRLRFSDRTDAADVIEADFSGGALSINGSATGSIYEIDADSTPSSTAKIAFAAVADVLTITAGSGVTAATDIIIQRVTWS
jgi:hypothetical protein